MKIDDIFFALGLIIFSSLLVFVIYDDVTTIQYHMDLKNLDLDISDTVNMSENETLILPNGEVNKSAISLKQETQTTYTKNSDSSHYTQNSNTGNNYIQSSNSQKNNVNNNVKDYPEKLKTSNMYKPQNDKVFMQGQSDKSNNRMGNKKF